MRPTTNRRTRIIAIALITALAAILTIRAWLFTDLPDIDDLDSGLHTPSIRITDRHGRLLYEVIGEEAGRNTVVPLDTIPDACQQATIATEDANFYSHPGIDLRGIIRAMWINIRGGEIISGGSTITQQVARNTLLDPAERSERTLTRKLRESILAYRLTQRYSKDDILALYLNQTYYGNLAYGIDAAARAYFGKPITDLDLAECALLAGLPQAPAFYDPLTDPDAAQERQAIVLGLMHDAGYITAEQQSLAGGEVLQFASERYSIEAPHFVAAVYTRLESAIPPEVFYAGGLEVRTTLDLDWQNTAQRIAIRHIDLLNRPDVGDPPHNAGGAAVVVIDPTTGEILTMLGNIDFFNAETSGAVNMALAPRQPGSALKPFTYAAAFDPRYPDPMTPASMILDVETSFVTHDGYSYTPVNYDRQEHGPVLARESLASSYNIPAVLTLDRIGIDRLFSIADQVGISTFYDPDNYDLALTLGGGEVQLVELTAAYGALANGGYHVEPVMILEVTNSDGEVIYSERGGMGERVIDERVAWLISDILSDNLARSPGFTPHSILQIGRPAAVKTGTTTDFRDNWTVGYTPELVVGVWVGNPNNSPMEAISGVSGAGPIWHHMMRNILRGVTESNFIRPDGLVQVEVCSLSGLLPSPNCPYTQLEWFIVGTEPSEYDSFYQRIDSDIYLNLPPAAHDWARSQGLPLLPDHLIGDSTNDGGEHLEIIIVSPDDRNVYEISPETPLDSQRLRIVVAGSVGLRDVMIFLDGEVLAMIPSAPFEIWWVLSVGEHEIYAEGVTADGVLVRSEVIGFRVDPPE